jgi:hypothetical protein
VCATQRVIRAALQLGEIPHDELQTIIAESRKFHTNLEPRFVGMRPGLAVSHRPASPNLALGEPEHEVVLTSGLQRVGNSKQSTVSTKIDGADLYVLFQIRRSTYVEAGLFSAFILESLLDELLDGFLAGTRQVHEFHTRTIDGPIQHAPRGVRYIVNRTMNDGALDFVTGATDLKKKRELLARLEVLAVLEESAGRTEVEELDRR